MMFTDFLKKIYGKYFSSLKRNAVYYSYFDNPRENLSMCNLKLDVRNPVEGRKYVQVGRDSSVNGTAVFETMGGYLSIGNRVFCGNAIFISASKIQIDDNVQIAWDCLFYDHNAHSFDWRERHKDMDVYLKNKKSSKDVLKNVGKNWDAVHKASIHICQDVWIGEGVTVLNGVTIGEGATIGSGSVVREDIPAWSIAYGNPCKVVAMNKYRPDA